MAVASRRTVKSVEPPAAMLAAGGETSEKPAGTVSAATLIVKVSEPTLRMVNVRLTGLPHGVTPKDSSPASFSRLSPEALTTVAIGASGTTVPKTEKWNVGCVESLLSKVTWPR